MNRSLTDNILDKLMNVALYAIFIVPFMNPYSYLQGSASKFSSEAMSLGIALIIAVLCILKAKKVSIASAGIACLLFAILLLAQPLVIDIRFPGVNMVVALESIVAAIMSIGITSLIDGDEEIQKKFILQLAWAVLIGVTIQAIYGFLQYTGQAANIRNYILYINDSGANVFGNIGQKNDYADFISIGIFALAYLYFIRQINLAVFVIYALFFGFILTINTSRTSFVYFIFATLATLSFILVNRKSGKYSLENKRVLFILVGMIIGFFILEAGLPKLIAAFSTAHESATSGLYRLDDSSTVHRRVYEWYKDIVLFLQHPIFGIGWGQYSHEGIYIMNTPRFMYIPVNTALYTHSHNSPLNILAESGIVGFAITMVYGFGYSLYRMFRNFNNHATLFLSFMILTIFGQSCFQYPLWYAYFFMYFVLFLSVDKPIFQINNNYTIKGFFVLILVGFAALCWFNFQTYTQLVSYTQVPEDTDDYTNNIQQLEQIVNNNPLWSLQALMVLDNYILPTSPKTNAAMSMQDQVRYIDKLANQLPYTGAIFKQIIVHRVVGDDAKALEYANLLAHAYPKLKDQFASQLQSSPLFNAEVSAIYNFKYEDRSIFAPKNKDN